MPMIALGGREVRSAGQPFVIAEAGINHNGELETAFEMIRTARAAGVDAVKFQTFRADEFISDPALMFSYRSQGTLVTESMLEMFRRYEFSSVEWRAIKECCDSEGITFLSTPQNVSDMHLLREIGVSALKVGSDDFTNLPLLRDYARTGLPLLISCGMADLAEVHQALEATGANSGYPVVLLLCTSQYPTPPVDVNLLKLRTLAAAFPHLLLGFSDHTQGPLASSVAVALGATVFEKHFTLDHDLAGPDHWFSEDPRGLREWVTAIRTAHSMLGSPLVRPTEGEVGMRSLARRSITSLRAIEPGEVLDASNLGMRRPGDGLAAQFWPLIEGKRAAKPIAKGRQLSFGDIE